MKCEMCENGEVWTECCNGSNGCPCEGRQVFFGICEVCHGTGERTADADTGANLQSLRHAAVVTGGYLGNPHGRLR